MQTNEDYLETRFPSQYMSYDSLYERKNPYIPLNFLQTWPYYLAPEFGQYYTNPLRGSLNGASGKLLNSNPNGVGDVLSALDENYRMNKIGTNGVRNHSLNKFNYNMLEGGQEAFQNVPNYPYLNATKAYENDYYFTNNNHDIGDVYNDSKYFEKSYRNKVNESSPNNSINNNNIIVNTPMPVRDPNCMTQNLQCKSDEILATKYPTEIWRGNKKCACYKKN
jgi:hypothetical protein